MIPGGRDLRVYPECCAAETLHLGKAAVQNCVLNVFVNYRTFSDMNRRLLVFIKIKTDVK